MTAYTLFSGNAHGLGNGGSTSGNTLGVEFEVSQTVQLTGIWWYSGPSATVLPTACCLFDANAGTQIAGTLNSSPSWSGAAGSGWVKCTYAGPNLSSGTKYVSAVYYGGGSLNWYYDLSGYWTSGGGSAGITNGPLSAPNSAGAVNGQAVYNPGTSGIAFPNSTVTGYDFGVDVEVTPAAAVAGALPLAQPGRTWRRRFQHPQQAQASPATAVPATVTGVTAALTLAALAGTVTAGGTVAGVTPNLALAAPAGAVTAGAAVAGVVSPLALAAPAGTVSAGAVIAGVTPNLALSAPPGTVTAGGAVTGVTPNLVLAAPAGSVSAGTGVTGVPAALTLAAPAGTVTASAAIAGTVAQLTLTAPAGSVTTGAGVAGAVAALTFTAPAGTATAAATVAGAVARLALAAPPGSVSNGIAVPLEQSLLGGTVTPAPWGGSVTIYPYAGTISGGVVGVQSDLQAVVGNDAYFYLAITYNGAALNLTGYTLKAYQKASRLTPDSEAQVYTTSSGLTVTNVAGGLVTWVIPHANLDNPTTLWYRVDVIDSSNEVFTCLYGNLQVLPA